MIRHSLRFLFLTLLAASTTTAAATDRVDFEPSMPAAGEPARVLFAGEWIAYPDPEAPRPTVEVSGDIVRVVQRVIDIGVISPYPYQLAVDLPELDAGLYTVELVARLPNGVEGTVVSAPLEVVRPLTVTPSTPLPTSSRPFTLVFERVSLCATFAGPVTVEGNIIHVPFDPPHRLFRCPVSPPLVDLRTPPIGPLPPGDYTVVVPWDVDLPAVSSNISHRSELTVLPEPVVLDERFEVTLEWRDGQGGSGPGLPARPPSGDSGLFWFFNAENWEVMVKVLDGCAVNGHWWVFAGATTDVEVTLRVRDTVSDLTQVYVNPLGTAAPAINDTTAFPCDP